MEIQIHTPLTARPPRTLGRAALATLVCYNTPWYLPSTLIPSTVAFLIPVHQRVCAVGVCSGSGSGRMTFPTLSDEILQRFFCFLLRCDRVCTHGYGGVSRLRNCAGFRTQSRIDVFGLQPDSKSRRLDPHGLDG